MSTRLKRFSMSIRVARVPENRHCWVRGVWKWLYILKKKKKVNSFTGNFPLRQNTYTGRRNITSVQHNEFLQTKQAHEQAPVPRNGADPKFQNSPSASFPSLLSPQRKPLLWLLTVWITCASLWTLIKWNQRIHIFVPSFSSSTLFCKIHPRCLFSCS